MAAGIKALRKIQFGKEAVAGTAVVCSTIWRGEGVLVDDRPVEMPAEDIGAYEGYGRAYVPKLGAHIELSETPATFEQLPLLLELGVKAVTTGATDTGGSGKIYAYPAPVTAANTLLTATIEGGDNQRADEMEYSHVESFSLSGAKGEAVMMGGTVRGRQATDAEFTGTATLPTVEEVLFQKGKLYIDATTIGTTQKTQTWLGFSLEWPSGWKEVYTGDGNLYFTKLEYVGHKDDPITGELILEHDSVAEAEIVAARAQTLRLVRMQFDGTALTTAGSAYTYKALRIDLAIKYTAVPEVGDEDGDDIVTLPFQVVYASAAAPSALAAQITVVNQLSAIIS